MFCLPVNVIKFLVAGVISLDDEGIPQSDWLLFWLFESLMGAIPYLSKLLAWAMVFGVLYFLDDEHRTDALLSNVVSTFNLDGRDMPYVQIAGHGIVVIFAIAIRFALWLLVGFRSEIWLGNFCERKILGEARTKAIVEYVNTISKREGIFGAIEGFLHAIRRALFPG